MAEPVPLTPEEALCDVRGLTVDEIMELRPSGAPLFMRVRQQPVHPDAQEGDKA